MRYISTRGEAPAVDFRTVLLSGLAPDGGLYVPETWPQIGVDEIRTYADMSFADVAARLMARFSGDYVNEEKLRSLTTDAYASFSHNDVAPLVPIGDGEWLLELFHGPTLAFKDVAMQLLGRLYEYALEGSSQKKMIIGATSGDTGGAAIEAFKGAANVALVMLHPKGRISEVQRRIMTTTGAVNIVNIAVDGAFDDCQRIVKALFGDERLREKCDLGGVNSINWVRLAVQTVYYFTAAAKLGLDGPPASFVAPTGNFGDVFAGYAAKRMGLPLARLCVAVNENDIMHRALSTGRYEPATTVATTSPSMDIQIASNFERLLFEAAERDAGVVRSLMREFDDKRGITLPPAMLEKIRKDFTSRRVGEEEVAATINKTLADHDMLIDPHTAVGVAAHRRWRQSGENDGPIVTLATAHPAKFPDAVEAASGQRPGLPPAFADLFAREEAMIEAPANIAAIRDIIIGAA